MAFELIFIFDKKKVVDRRSHVTLTAFNDFELNIFFNAFFYHNTDDLFEATV